MSMILFTLGTHWHLWVKTSNESLSGTDAKVFVCLYGTKGKTDEVELDNKSDVFEQGNTDEFDIHVSDVGKPYKLRVFHDDTSLMSGWKLDKVGSLISIKDLSYCTHILHTRNQNFCEIIGLLLGVFTQKGVLNRTKLY